MGDRVLYVVVDEDSPRGVATVYSHWGGETALEVLKAAAPQMRKDQASYATARLCQAVCNAAGPNGHLGAGIFEAPTEEDFANFFETFTHGDAGVIVVNVSTGEVNCYAGYLEGEEDHLEFTP